MLRVSNTVGVTSLLFILLLFLLHGAAEPPSSIGKRHLVLTNKAHQPIVEVHIADDDRASNWQKDLLRSEFLLPGSSKSVEINEDKNGNCWVDAKIVLDNGSKIIFRHLNSCYGDHTF